MVPLTSFQNVLVARFTGLDLPGRRRWVATGAGIIVVATGLLAGLAALVGPPLLTLVFGDKYQAGAGVIAGLTVATAGLGIITLTGIAAMTAARHTIYLLGWGTAIVVTLLLLFLAPLPLEWATVVALVAGPLAGAAVQIQALRQPRGSDREGQPAGLRRAFVAWGFQPAVSSAVTSATEALPAAGDGSPPATHSHP
jgi:O-antigen/teichoic acid export membrane protein